MQVGVVILRGQRAARKGIVVVERHSVYGDPHAVDRQSVGRAGGYRAEARADRDAVGHGLVADRGCHGVERRPVGAPERGILDGEGYDDGFAVEFGPLALGVGAGAVRTRDGHVQHAGVVAFRGDVHLDFALCLLGRHALLPHEHALRTEVERRYGRAFGEDQLRFAVDAAVEVHVGRGRKHVVAVAVADHHEHGVVGSEPDLVGDLEGECRGAAAVRADVVAVDEEVGHRLHAVELHEQALRGPFGGNVHAVLVVARGFEPVALGQRVGVPAVGQGDVAGVVGGFLRLEEKSPTFVDRKYLAGAGRCGEAREQQENRYVSFHGRLFFSVRDKDSEKNGGLQNRIACGAAKRPDR